MSPPDTNVEFQGPAAATAIGEHNTINVIYQNGEKRTVEIFRLFDPIDEKRRLAQEWRSLHEDYHQISSYLADVRAIVAREEDPDALVDLTEHWLNHCFNCLDSFIELKGLPETDAVRRDFMNDQARWLQRLKSWTSKVNEAIGRCVEPEDLRIHQGEILEGLRCLENTGTSLLGFIDRRLRKVFFELEAVIAEARKELTVPPNAMQPGAPS